LRSEIDSATLSAEGRQIIVRSDEGAIDGTTVNIPAGCREIEFTVSRGTLEVFADGKPGGTARQADAAHCVQREAMSGSGLPA
jgi:hypothetical protein